MAPTGMKKKELRCVHCVCVCACTVRLQEKKKAGRIGAEGDSPPFTGHTEKTTTTPS